MTIVDADKVFGMNDPSQNSMFSFQLNHHMIEQKQKGSFYET
jgi:hypothetical protein